ncbi:hypothetical protein [Roseobacter sp. CCS2]|uniref:hypothetical protein n=1 Tax=Roseobacter sp. CCS2 TaxID=391593 RepID=UPI0000F3E465|nr:hypothetical protein [Roseobacter sp. CCS2]EBA12860.1 hypothetical protein RCCS2_16224 [Roseobacter sp. CCS2]
MTDAKARFDLLWCGFVVCLLLVLVTVAHMQITIWSDYVGFSSNRDFYFSVRHPVRAMIRDGIFLSGLAGIGTGLFLLWRRSRYVALQGLLVIAGTCVSFCLMIMLLIFVFTIFVLLRGDADMRNIVTIILQMLPSVTALVAISLFFKRVRQHAKGLRWCLGVSMAVLSAQGIWLLDDGVYSFLLVAAICIAVLATIVVLVLSGDKSHREKAL